MTKPASAIDKKYGIGHAKGGSKIIWFGDPAGPKEVIIPKRTFSTHTTKTYKESRLNKKPSDK